jgi:hypothetical protein
MVTTFAKLHILKGLLADTTGNQAKPMLTSQLQDTSLPANTFRMELIMAAPVDIINHTNRDMAVVTLTQKADLTTDPSPFTMGIKHRGIMQGHTNDTVAAITNVGSLQNPVSKTSLVRFPICVETRTGVDICRESSASGMRRLLKSFTMVQSLISQT